MSDFFQEFFLNVKCLTRHICAETKRSTFSKWSKFELDLQEKFSEAKENVHNALCGNNSVLKIEMLFALFHCILQITSTLGQL